MNLRVILFLLAVVVLILCVTGAKIKNNNMQKLIKCSVPLVLFMTLILCMSKNVEPYCNFSPFSGGGASVLTALSSSTLSEEKKENLRNALTDNTNGAATEIAGIDGGRLGFGGPGLPQEMEFLRSRGKWIDGCGLYDSNDNPQKWATSPTNASANAQAGRLCQQADGLKDSLANYSDLGELLTYTG